MGKAGSRIAGPATYTENRRKEGDDFNKMDEESIVIVCEELSDDFLSLA